MNVLKLSSFKTTFSVVMCLSLGLLTGCENCEIINCEPYQQLSFVITEFSINEMNPIEVRSFRKGGNFTELVHEWIITPDNADFVKLDASIDYYTISPRENNFTISSAFDYEFFVPSTGTRWLLSEITPIKLQEEYCRFSLAKDYCTSGGIRSYNLNGTLYVGGIPPFIR